MGEHDGGRAYVAKNSLIIAMRAVPVTRGDLIELGLQAVLLVNELQWAGMIVTKTCAASMVKFSLCLMRGEQKALKAVEIS